MSPETWEAWDREWTQGQIDADWKAKSKVRTDVAHAEVAQRVKALRAGSVLDVGCGGGTLSRYVRGAAGSARYTGVDVSKKMLSAARRINTGATFRLGDGAKLEEKDLSVDVVVLRHVLTHQPLFKGERLLHEAARVARTAVMVSLYRAHEGEPAVEERLSGPFYDNSWSTDWIVDRMAGWGFPVAEATRLGDQDLFLDFRRKPAGKGA